jgi:hypothetical protein
MQYEEFSTKKRPELQIALNSQNPERIREALVSAIYDEPDWRWTQEACLQFISHQDARVRLAAAECLGGLARSRSAPLDLDRVLPALKRLVSDSEMGFAARDALDDINFMRGK